MKRILFLLVASLITTTSIFAQQKREFKKMHGKHKHEFLQQLNLSDAQKQQMKQQRESYKKQIMDLEKNENITVKEYRDRKETLRKEQKSKFETLLTAEQKSKIEQLKKERKAKAEEHFSKRVEMMKSKLNLTDAQLSQMKQQREDMHKKLSTIKENESLSRTEKKEQFMALKESMKEQRKKLFTEDQLKQLEEMKKNRMNKDKNQ